MASESKRERFKAWIRKPFPSKNDKTVSTDPQSGTPTTSLTARSSYLAMNESSPGISTPKIDVTESSPQVPTIHASSSGGILTYASNFAMINPVMNDNSTTTMNIHGASNETKAMERLFERIIQGADHDSSDRDPPPRCHPGTRFEINQYIITWFYDQQKRVLLIWVYGPAGVGKSAIMQTLAEKLAESKHLGASVFVSRPNGRNASRKLFMTIGYQLAVHIDDYRTFITDKLSRNPALVNKGMEEQFKIFIVEPFVEKKIGVGGAPWGILLDGLDELDEHRSQREIIRLISNFVLEHPDVPLLWAIASRPEPHISDTFDNQKVVPAHLRIPVPANSKESRRDVERFLRDSLERIRGDFPRTVPKEWPSEDQCSHLVTAASGLFAFAQTAIRFIEDPRYANPPMRLRQILSALDGLTPTSDDQPFASLDALYMSILSSIPSDVWPTTKRVLGTLLYAQGEMLARILRTLEPMSTILRLDLATVYASVQGCYALLRVAPSYQDASYIEPVTFYHASFSDFLVNSTRSKNFSISIEEVENDTLQSTLSIWQDFKTGCPTIPGLTYENTWVKYLSPRVPLAGNHIESCLALYWYIHKALFIFLVEKHDPKAKRPFSSEEDQHQCFNLLSQLDDATICEGFSPVFKFPEFLLWLFDIWEIYEEELVSRGVIQRVGLEQAQFCQLQIGPAHTCITQGKSTLNHWLIDGARFGTLLRDISHLASRFPQLPVFTCGHQGQGCLLFRHQSDASDLQKYGLNSSILSDKDPIWQIFVLPYSPSNFNHFKASLETIQANNPQAMHNIQPSANQFLRLRDIASHQPVFANLAIQFIEDPQFGDSATCLNQILALIDKVDPSNDQQFVYVDALYTHILGLVPSDIWPITQKVLGTLYYGVTYEGSCLKSPKAVSIVLGIELSVVYTALSCCSPMVFIPPKNIPLGYVAFHHPSFCEYLMDSTRSQIFYISIKAIEDQTLKLFINIWQDFKQSLRVPGWYSFLWNNYCSQYHPHADPSDYPLINTFNRKFFYDTHSALFVSMRQYSPAELESKQIQDYVFHMLSQLDFLTIHEGFRRRLLSQFVQWLLDIWTTYQSELTNRSLVHETKFQELQFDHLKHIYGSCHTLLCNSSGQMQRYFAMTITTPEELDAYKSDLELFQQHRPQLQVLISGRPGGCFALFKYEYTEADLRAWSHHPADRALRAGDQGYYIFPYPDSV